jgi:hypothetical protein
MTALIGIAGHLRAVFASHIALQLVDRRRLLPAHDVERNSLMSVAAETADLKIDVPALSASPSVGDGCAGPLKSSMRLVQASQASLSASLRASAARSAATRTEVP